MIYYVHIRSFFMSEKQKRSICEILLKKVFDVINFI